MSKSVSPGEALERIFEVIREEAVANPTFAKRLLDAAGVTVVFSGPDAAKVADPILAAARAEYADFRESFIGFTEKDLKSLLKGFALATDEQIKSVKTKPKQSGLVDLMWEGAKRKLDERRVK
ncbi:MAG: hypothetical protein J0H36_08370 [Hyphomicrobium denitrificans]|uniref:Uncharacterized protein n=1 Tax=Hyphomicrobium denitrificans (strain ATCC 51888 / DSM 1869 / NCIMB 11706 / TK 0415) TaxID=582899 RepID=D8JYW4_HYPDA|nr:hypothetical protein [Hyphomicrobium denitrificans]ADJ23566.1 hypothetical protein Hden_1763 [Hyphomicrobium denitrificans ATCC 51888]MBN9291115.1 hypothetical protein [Hyphomicrobium denitrificans]